VYEDSYLYEAEDAVRLLNSLDPNSRLSSIAQSHCSGSTVRTWSRDSNPPNLRKIALDRKVKLKPLCPGPAELAFVSRTYVHPVTVRSRPSRSSSSNVYYRVSSESHFHGRNKYIKSLGQKLY